MVCIMSAPEVMRLVRMGRYVGSEESTGLLALLKRFKPSARRESGKPHNQQTAGAKQMALLRRLPSLLRFVPGTAQDLRVFFLTMRYWLAGSEQNLANLIRMLVQRYAQGPRSALGKALKVALMAFESLPTKKAPTAAPLIISTSSGCQSAARWPPAMAKPPNTEAITTT